MNQKEKPKCYIIAGPNGAGKTTFAMKFLSATVDQWRFFNIDEIVHDMSPDKPKEVLFRATRQFIRTVGDSIDKKEAYIALETTLSARTYMRMIPQWQQKGWEVTLIYLYLSNVELSRNRVAQRVAQGGHNIPEEDIVRRYPRSVGNLFLYAKICDRTLCLDNSGSEAKVIFEQTINYPPEIKDQALYEEMAKEI